MADESRVFIDTREGVDWVERYAAFLQLQNEAPGLTDQEYLDRLAMIDGTGAFQAGEFGYTDEELGGLSDAERLAILEAQEDLEDGNVGRPKQVMQFGGGTVPISDMDAGTNVFPAGQSGEPDELQEGGQHGAPEADPDDGTRVLADGTVVYPDTQVGAAYPDGTDVPEDGTAPEERDSLEDPDASDPGLDIVYGGEGDGTVLAGGAAVTGIDEEKDDPEDELEDGAPEAAQPQPDAPEQSVPAAPVIVPEDEEDGPGPETQLGWAPAGGVPDFEAGMQTGMPPVPEGHVVVSEEIQINDWLDELGAGLGLVSGVQTAEYIPPEPREQPQQVPQAQPVRSEAMRQLDRMVERIYGPADGGAQKEADGPSR